MLNERSGAIDRAFLWYPLLTLDVVHSPCLSRSTFRTIFELTTCAKVEVEGLCLLIEAVIFNDIFKLPGGTHLSHGLLASVQITYQLVDVAHHGVIVNFRHIGNMLIN